jgi:hypothetical protein
MKKYFCPIGTVFTFLKLADKSKHVLLRVIFTSDLPFRRHRDRKGYSPKLFVGRTVSGLPFSQFLSDRDDSYLFKIRSSRTRTLILLNF